MDPPIDQPFDRDLAAQALGRQPVCSDLHIEPVLFTQMPLEGRLTAKVVPMQMGYDNCLAAKSFADKTINQFDQFPLFIRFS